MADEAHWSVPWRDRPVEEARVFNPAFCGELIGHTIGEYNRIRKVALNMVTAYLVLPLTLHGPTRKALPKKANTAFAGWVADHAALLAELPRRTMSLRPVSREALLFAVSHQFIALDAGGLVVGVEKAIRSAAKPAAFETDEVIEIRRAARLLGRWFAAQGTQVSILQGMGIAP